MTNVLHRRAAAEKLSRPVGRGAGMGGGRAWRSAGAACGLVLIGFLNPSYGQSPPRKDEEKVPAALLQPGYDVPEEARDPFYPPAAASATASAGRSDGGKTAPGTKLPDAGAPVMLEELQSAVRVEAVFGKGDGTVLAVINGQTAQAGDAVKVVVRGQPCDVHIEHVDLQPPTVSMKFRNTQFRRALLGSSKPKK